MVDIIVSVCTITYGHEHYIKDTIEGVLSQQTDFNFEFLIADDCSPDQTQQVVEELIRNHKRGKLINYTKHPTNKGMGLNFVWTLGQCRGQYIAICEGDDYWTDPLKLQKQVDHLRSNPDAIINFHDFDKIDSSGDLIEKQFYSRSELPLKHDFNSVFRGAWFPTLTVLFKNVFLKVPIPKRLALMPYPDQMLWLYLLQNGVAVFLKDIKSAKYRIHNQGVWSGQNEFKRLKSKVEQYLLIRAEFPNRSLNETRFKVYLKSLIYLCFKNRHYQDFVSYMILYVKTRMNLGNKG